MGQVPVVVYFAGMAGDNLCGLGESQKGEVKWLEEQGLQYEKWDIHDFVKYAVKLADLQAEAVFMHTLKKAIASVCKRKDAIADAVAEAEAEPQSDEPEFEEPTYESYSSPIAKAKSQNTPARRSVRSKSCDGALTSSKGGLPSVGVDQQGTQDTEAEAEAVVVICT